MLSSLSLHEQQGSSVTYREEAGQVQWLLAKLRKINTITTEKKIFQVQVLRWDKEADVV
jgi:hypothetical protein